MFTGLVEGTGRVRGLKPRGAGVRLCVQVPFTGLVEGESVSVNGACVTAVTPTEDAFEADLSPETLERTTLGRLAVGARVNLERAAALGSRLGGHLVTGHVDGRATVVSMEDLGEMRRVALECPSALARYVAEKGSVSLDGVSLTVNAVDGARFSVLLIPHTLTMTTFGDLESGMDVNLEVDLVARYVERLRQVEAS